MLNKQKSSLHWSIIAVLVVIAFLFFLPYIASIYSVSLMTEILILALFALSLNLIMGYTGMVSFGHAMFYGLGAYASAFVLVKWSIQSIEFAILMGIVWSLIVGLFVGYLSVRTHYIFFAMITLGFGQVLHSISIKWYTVTGGSDGIIGVSRPDLFGFINISPTINYYYFVLGVVAISTYILWRIKNSPFGQTLKAIRDNPQRAEFVGINVQKHQLIAFIIAAMFAGVAGSMYGPYAYQASPEILIWHKSGEAVFMVLLGGAFNFFGPLVGALAYVLIHDFITKYTIYWMIFMGSILVSIVLFFPGGIVGFFNDYYNKLFKKGIAIKQ